MSIDMASREDNRDRPDPGLAESQRFWEAKARENPYWYVSSYGAYDRRDLNEFWRSGVKIWNDLKKAIGYQPAADHTVVEIGCGVGRLTRAIAPEVGRVVAFDLSEQMLEVARTGRLPNATFLRSDGRSLRPMPTASANLILAYCVFQHLPSHAVLAEYLNDMVRVARPGGLVAFTLTPRTWAHSLRPLLRARQWVKERLRPDGPRDLYRHAWLGIRPAAGAVHRLSPIALTETSLHRDKWLLYGRTSP